MPTWKEKKKALRSMPQTDFPSFGDLYQVFLPQEGNQHWYVDYCYYEYKEGVTNINSRLGAMETGDMLTILDKRPFKLGREFHLVYSVRLQVKVYVYTIFFARGWIRRLESL